MQPRVENGNANPLMLCEPLRCTLFIWVRVRFSPSGWQVKNNSAFRAMPLARSWPHLMVSDFLFFFSPPKTDEAFSESETTAMQFS